MSIHLKGLKYGDLGEATIIVGDPGRVELISQDWRDKKKLVDSREFVVVSGLWKNHLVSICSTGIGSGSTEIAVTELIENGAKKNLIINGQGQRKMSVSIERNATMFIICVKDLEQVKN